MGSGMSNCFFRGNDQASKNQTGRNGKHPGSSSSPDNSSATANTAAGFTFAEVSSVRASASKVVCCHFSSDGKLLASGGHDKKVVLWHTDTLKPKTALEEHSSLITDVRFSARMEPLANSSFDKTVRVWDADNGGTAQVRFQPRVGRYLAAAAENVVSILDVETQACRHILKGHTKPIHSVCWDPSGELLASVSEDSVRVWTLRSGSEGDCLHELSCNGNIFDSCVFHPTYSSLLVIGCNQLWNMIENKAMTLPAHEGLIASLAVSTVAGLVASASHDKIVKLWK